MAPEHPGGCPLLARSDDARSVGFKPGAVAEQRAGRAGRSDSSSCDPFASHRAAGDARSISAESCLIRENSWEPEGQRGVSWSQQRQKSDQRRPWPCSCCQGFEH